MQRLIEAEAATHIGAGPHERAATRTTYRNGYRERILDTGSGRLEICRPQPAHKAISSRHGSSPGGIDRALLAVVQEAYVLGISTRKVDDLMAALGGCSISRSEGESLKLAAMRLQGDGLQDALHAGMADPHVSAIDRVLRAWRCAERTPTP